MRRHIIQRHLQGQRGFVLILTLAMIVIAVAITARTANRSLTRTLESIDAEHQLRNRWSRKSLVQSVLSRADQIFTNVEVARENGQFTAWHDANITLSGTTFRLRLADENAKINLNVARRTHANESFLRIIRQSNSLPVQIGLQTLNKFDQPVDPAPPLESWGQVFRISNPLLLLDATSNVTLWGNGRLNIHRATDQSIRQLLKDIASSTDIDALLRQRRDLTRDSPFTTPPADNIPAYELIGDYLTETSQCHSLWIVSQAEGQAELHIRESQTNRTRLFSFRW